MWLVRRWRLAAEIALAGQVQRAGLLLSQETTVNHIDREEPCCGFTIIIFFASITKTLICYTRCHIPDPPFRLGREGLRLIVGCGGSDDLIAVFVNSARLCGSELRLLFGLLLNLGNLLPLLRGSRDLHTQDDVTDLRLGQ